MTTILTSLKKHATALGIVISFCGGAWFVIDMSVNAQYQNKIAGLEDELKKAKETITSNATQISTLTKDNGILQKQVAVATNFIEDVEALPTQVILDKNQPHLESSGTAIIKLLEVNGQQARLLLNQENPVTVEKDKPFEFSGITGNCTVTMIEAYTERQAAKLQIKCVRREI